MKLPEKFQYRVHHSPGFTHTAKMLENGDLKVKWARGWDYHITQKTGDKSNARPIMPRSSVENFVKLGLWIIVDERRHQEESLPDVIHFEYFGTPYVLTNAGDTWRCWHKGQIGNEDQGSYYFEEELKKYFADGTWERYEPVVLTAEQQRANKDCQERIAALNSSIKLNQQDIEHRNRLIANYEQQIKDLKAKIVESDE